MRFLYRELQLATVGVALSATSALAVVDVNKSFAPINVQPGQTTVVAIELINSVGIPATNASILDTLPATLMVVSLGSNTCGGTWSSPAAGQLQLVGGTVPAASGATSGSCRATALVSSTVPGTYVNTIAAGDLTSSEGSNPQSANATLTVNPVLNVTGTKLFAPTVVHGNGLTRFTVTLSNPNASMALTGVAFVDTFPTQLVVGTPVFTATTCGGLVQGRTGAGAFGAPVGGNTAVRLTGGTLAAGSFCTVSVDVRPTNANAVLDANVTNTVAASAVTTTQGATNPAAIAGAVRVQTAAQVVKTFVPSTITAGGTSTVTLTLRNYNLAPVPVASFTDVMPAGVTVVAGSAATTCGGVASTTAANVVLTGGTIPAAPSATAIGFGSCTLTATVTAAAAGSYNNTITAGNFSGVAYAATSAVLTVNPPGAVGVTKAFAPTSAPESGTTTLTITLTKAAAGAAAITSFTDNLTTMGTGITVAAAPPASTTCGGTVSAPSGGTLITKTDGTIPAAGACTITVPLRIAVGATASTRTNTVTAGALVTSTGSNTFAATAAFTVLRAATVAKGFSPTTVGPGQTSRLTITVSHANGAVALTGMGLVDTLPAGHTVAAAPVLTNTCGGMVAAAPTTSTITLTGGGLPLGATSCAIAVNVQTPATAGSSTNTIPASALTTTEGVTYNVAATAVLTRAVSPGVTLNKGFVPVNIGGGAPATLSLIVANNRAGATGLTNVSLTDAFPGGMQVFGTPAASFTGTGCSGASITAVPGAPQVSFVGASITAGAVCTLALQVTSIVDGNLVNDVPVGALTSAQGASNVNAPSATLTVQRNVNVTKFFTPGIIEQSAVSVLTVRIVNTNTTVRTGAAPALVDALPSGVVVATGPFSTTCGGGVVVNGAGFALSPGDTTVRLDGGVFPASGTCDVVVPVTGATPGLYTNTIPAGAIATVEGGTNNLPAVADLRIVQPPTIGKAFSPATIPVGGTSTVTFTLTNPNAASLLPGGFTGANFGDALANMAIRAPGPANGTCAGVAGNTFSAGQTALAFTGLTVLPAASCTVTVEVISTVVGVHPNVTTGVSTAQTVAPGPPSNTPELTVLGPPTVAKSFSPTTVAPGVPSTLTVTIVNPNATVALLLASPALFDPLPTAPGAMTLASGVVSSTCGGTVEGRTGAGAFGVPVAGHTELRLSGGSVPAAGSCVVSTAVVVPVPGSYVNGTSPVATLNAGTSLAGASATLTAEPQADLQVTKTASPSPYVPGAPLTYTIAAVNAGPSPVTGARVEDVLPAALAAFTWTCTPGGGATCGTASGTGSIDALVTLPVGGTATFSVTGTVPQATTGVLANTVTITAPAGVTELLPPSNSATASSTAAPLADVSVTKSATPTPFVAGASLTYTLVVANAGPSPAAGVRVEDTLPAPIAAFTWTCLGAGGGACGTVAGSGSLDTLVDLPPGASTTFTFIGIVPSSTIGTLVNSGRVTVPAGVTDPDLTNNDASTSTPSRLEADLTVSKSSTPSPYVPGLPLTYTVVVSNLGPSDASGARVVDVLPIPLATFTWTCSGTGGGTCGAGSGSGSLDTLVTLPAGTSVTFAITGTVPSSSAGALVNTAIVTEPTGVADPVPGNNSATDASPTSVMADVAITKTSAPNPYVPGALLTYTLVATNAGPSDAVDARVQDALPPAIAGFTWTCVSGAGAVCATASGAGSIDARVSLVVGASATFVLSGTVPPGVTGTLVNTATIAASVGALDPVPGNNTASDANATSVVTDLGIAKTSAPSPYLPGAGLTYTIVVSNAGPSTAVDARVQDALPPLLRAFTWTCAAAGGASCNTAAGTGDIDALVKLPPGATATFLVTGVVPLTASGALTNTATVAPPTGASDPTPANRSATDVNVVAAMIVPGGAELQLTHAFPPTVAPGGVAIFSYTSTNRGPGTAIDLMIDGMIPTGTTIASIVPSAGGVVSIVNGMFIVTWPGPTQPGESRTVTLALQVPPTAAPGAIVWNWIMTSSATPDPYQPNNFVDSYVFVSGDAPADLALAGEVRSGVMTGVSVAAHLGQIATMRLAVVNTGSVPARGQYALILDDASALQVVSATTTSGGLAVSGPASGVWDTGTVAPGDTITAQFEVRVVTARATTLLVARVDGAPSDPNALNDTVTLAIDGIGAAPLSGRTVAIGDLDGVGGGEIVVAAGQGETPQVRIFDGAGMSLGTPYYAFDREFTGGVRLAACDVDGDGRDEIVAGQGPGGGDVRVLRVTSGVFSNLVSFRPFETAFTGGVFVACADLDGDGRGEMVVGAGAGRAPDVRVFTVSAGAVVQAASFTAYEWTFEGGVRVSAGQVPTSAVGDFHIVTTPGPGRPVEIAVWRLTGSTASALVRAPVGGDLGASTALGDADNDGVIDLAVMPDTGAPALLTLIELSAGAVRASVASGALRFVGGAQMAIGDVGQGRAEIVLTDGAGGVPRVQVFQLSPAGGVRRLGFLALELP